MIFSNLLNPSLQSILSENGQLLSGLSLTLVGGSFVYLIRKYCNGPSCPEPLKEESDLTGQVVIVTGASKGGIGYETVRELYLLGATVVMAVRDVDTCQKECKELEREKVDKKKGKLIVMKVLLDDLTSVKEFALEFLQKFDRLDILVNNAGLGAYCGVSKQGIEIAFAVNYLSHFMLVHYLRQLIIDTSVKYSKNCKIINVGSDAHVHVQGSLKLTMEEICKSDMNTINAYCQSKLCMVLFTKSLARQFENTKIGCYCLHPGAVNTNVFRHVTFPLNVLVNVLRWTFFKTPKSGAQTQIYIALEKMENLSCGSYYGDCKKLEESEKSKNVEFQDQLWKLSEELCKDFIKQ